ncbi:hypothetical protein BAUCODRAFT_58175, partial [Baudoinia panamericana UAMH 10762]
LPIIITKCGSFLKQKGQEEVGLFETASCPERLQGLRSKFESPPKYGKNVDWKAYCIKDAANLLSLYLTELPEPVVPWSMYEQFRLPMHFRLPLPHAELSEEYADQILSLPGPNRRVLLYLLGLMALLAFKHERNGLTAAKQVSLFQPGLLSHPADRLDAEEVALNRNTLVYLI